MNCSDELKEEIKKELNKEAKKIVERYQSKCENCEISATIVVELRKKSNNNK